MDWRTGQTPGTSVTPSWRGNNRKIICITQPVLPTLPDRKYLPLFGGFLSGRPKISIRCTKKRQRGWLALLLSEDVKVLAPQSNRISRLTYGLFVRKAPPTWVVALIGDFIPGKFDPRDLDPGDLDPRKVSLSVT